MENALAWTLIVAAWLLALTCLSWLASKVSAWWQRSQETRRVLRRSKLLPRSWRWQSPVPHQRLPRRQ